MRKDDIKAAFDVQAAGYDKNWERMAPIRNGLHFLLDSVLADLPADARVLCVGAGTGVEIAHLAGQFPGWRFTAVDPSGPMLEVCRQRAAAKGFADRCAFHEGYLDSLPAGAAHDAATCFLVSQFLLDRQERSGLFREIANRLRPGGLLATADLASEIGSNSYEALLRVWINVMVGADIPPDRVARMRDAYANDVAVLPPAAVASIIESGGFESPVPFFQAGLMHAWFARRAPTGSG